LSLFPKSFDRNDKTSNNEWKKRVETQMQKLTCIVLDAENIKNHTRGHDAKQLYVQHKTNSNSPKK